MWTRTSFFIPPVVVLVLTASFLVVCLVFCELNIFLSLLSSFLFLRFVSVRLCLVFLDCGGLPLYGRWTVPADALWPCGVEGGFME